MQHTTRKRGAQDEEDTWDNFMYIMRANQWRFEEDTASSASEDDTASSASEPYTESRSSEDSEDEGSVSDGGGTGLFAACHEALAKTKLLRAVLGYVGAGHFLFVGGTSRKWRTLYTLLYPALTTSLVSVVSSVWCVRWAIRRGLELSVNVFILAARHGDVAVCRVLNYKNCPWDYPVISAALENKQHGLSILQWQTNHTRGKKLPYGISGETVQVGNLQILEWLLAEEAGCAPFNGTDWNRACEGGSVPVVEYLLNHYLTRSWLEQDAGGLWRDGPYFAAGKGRLGVLQLLHTEARRFCRWDAEVCQSSVVLAKSLATLKWLRSEAVQCPWDETSCPQVIRDREDEFFGDRSWDISDEAFEEIKQWVHANGHPCNCQD